MLVAEHQVAGRGRLDRVWTSPPRAGLTVSVLLRPDVPAARRGWLPLLTGVALAESVGEVDRRPRVAEVAQRPARPRRPQAGRDPRRGASGTAVVVGVGLNVSTTAEASCPTPARRWPRSPGPPSTGAPLLLAFLRASSGATGAGPRRSATRCSPGWPATTWPGAPPWGDRRRHAARRIDPGGRGRGGRLGRPARRRAPPTGGVELASRATSGTSAREPPNDLPGPRGAGPGGDPAADGAADRGCRLGAGLPLQLHRGHPRCVVLAIGPTTRRRRRARGRPLLRAQRLRHHADLPRRARSPAGVAAQRRVLVGPHLPGLAGLRGGDHTVRRLADRQVPGGSQAQLRLPGRPAGARLPPLRGAVGDGAAVAPALLRRFLLGRAGLVHQRGVAGLRLLSRSWCCSCGG